MWALEELEVLQVWVDFVGAEEEQVVLPLQLWKMVGLER